IIVNEDNTLEGILTSRDIKVMKSCNLIKQFMTPLDKMIVVFKDQKITMDEAKRIMCENRIQKLPIVNNDYRLEGLICLKDIERIEQRPLANLDKDGRLRCGAAVGVKEDTL